MKMSFFEEDIILYEAIVGWQPKYYNKDKEQRQNDQRLKICQESYDLHEFLYYQKRIKSFRFLQKIFGGLTSGSFSVPICDFKLFTLLDALTSTGWNNYVLGGVSHQSEGFVWTIAPMRGDVE